MISQLEGEIDKGWWNLSEIDENILFEKLTKKNILEPLREVYTLNENISSHRY